MAVSLAQPSHFLTLTQVGAEWPEVRSRLHRFRRTLKRAGWSIEDAYVVERHRSGAPHVHALVYGSRIPSESVVSEHATRAGMGWKADIRPCDVQMAGYLLKDTHTPDSLVEFLKLNGGRLIHPTRGYWRTPEGGHLGGMDAAIREAKRRHFASLAETRASDTQGWGDVQ